MEAYTPEPQTHVTQENRQQENSVIIRARKGTQKYNTRSRVNHVTTFKNTPQMFKKGMKDTSTTHIGSDYIAHTNPKIYTITVEPVEHHITFETTGKILGHGDLVKIDAPVWKNYVCNEIGRLSQGCKSNVGNDTIKFIFHKYKPKYRRETYVRSVYNIRPPKKDTHRTRLTAGGNLIYYPGKVSTPTSDLTTMKLHVNSAISDLTSIYMLMDVKDFYLNNQMDRDE